MKKMHHHHDLLISRACKGQWPGVARDTIFVMHCGGEDGRPANIREKYSFPTCKDRALTAQSSVQGTLQRVAKLISGAATAAAVLGPGTIKKGLRLS